MNGPTLQVQMLGQFTLRYGDRTISDSDDRSRRVWSLLAYMLYNHGPRPLVRTGGADPSILEQQREKRGSRKCAQINLSPHSHRAGQAAAGTWPPAHPPQSRTILLEQCYAAFPRY